MRSAERNITKDLLFLCLAGLVMGLYCVVGTRHRLMWSDELFGWMLCADPSWSHMLHAWNLGADGGGIGFYTLGRLWLDIFGHHLLAFRLYSTFGIFAGFAAAWFSMRRYYQPWFAAIALTAVWFGSRVLLWQMLQTRFYGLLLGAVACALWSQLRSAQDLEDRGHLRTSTLAFVFLSNLVLVSAHPFGFVYCTLLLAAGGFNDWLSKRRRPLYYAAVLLPWTVLLFSIKAIRSSSEVGKPWFWTVRPHRGELLDAFRPDLNHTSFLVALCLTAAAVGLLFWKAERSRILQGLTSRREILVPAVILFWVPVAFWIVSQRGTSYFVDRYFSPYCIGIAVLGAEVLTVLAPNPLRWSRPTPVLLAAALFVFSGYENVKLSMKTLVQTLNVPPARDLPAMLAAVLPRNEPVVVQRIDFFDLLMYYQDKGGLQLYNPIDWPLALNPQAPKYLVSATHEMENWKRAGYYPDHIVDSSEFLKTHTHFFVVQDEASTWFPKRVMDQPGWHVRQVGTFDDPDWRSTLWEVSR